VEYLISCSDGDWTLGYSQWPEVFRPNTLQFERLPGVEYRLLIAGVPVYFADEMPGIQIAVEGDLPEEVGRQLANDVLTNLERVTGQRGRIVEL
jgi:hypothetical protein